MVLFLGFLMDQNRDHKFSEIFYFNPQAPVAQKITDKVVFRHFQGDGVEFF